MLRKWLFINKAYEQGVGGHKNISWGVNKLIRGRRYGVQGTLESQYTFLLVNATSGPVFDRNLVSWRPKQAVNFQNQESCTRWFEYSPCQNPNM